MKKRVIPRRGRIPNRLWKYRKRMGFSQRQVAAILGVSRTRIAEYERGRVVPTLMRALELEIVYRVPVAFLFADHYARLKAKLRATEERVRAERDGHEAETAA